MVGDEIKRTMGCLAIGITGIYLGLKATNTYYRKRIDRIENTKNHYWNSFLMMDIWVGVNGKKEKPIASYLCKKGIKKIAIYGMGEAGKRLYEELKDSQIEIAYGIDASAGEVSAKIEVHFPEDDLEKVDAIIVTVPYYYTSVKKNLEKYGMKNIYALDEILNNIQCEQGGEK